MNHHHHHHYFHTQSLIDRNLLSRHFEDLKPSNIYESIQLALLQGDLSLFIKLASEMNIWLLCHLFDVLMACGVASAEIGEERTEKLAQDFLLRYSEDLMDGSEKYWSVAFSYLSLIQPSKVGRSMMQQMILRLPWKESPRSLQKILNLCQVHGLHNEKREIYNASLDNIYRV